MSLGVTEIILQLSFGDTGVSTMVGLYIYLPNGLGSLWLVLVDAKLWVKFLEFCRGETGTGNWAGLVARGGNFAVQFKVMMGADGL